MENNNKIQLNEISKELENIHYPCGPHYISKFQAIVSKYIMN